MKPGDAGLKILMSGMISRVPWQGGATWAVLQYLIGLRDLGYDIHFVEVLSSDTLTPTGTTFENSENARYFNHVIRSFGLDSSATLVNADTRESIGLPYFELLGYARRCDLLLNLSGLLRMEELITPIPLRAYVDIDPGFTQLWHLKQGLDIGLSGHNRFVTIGLKIGQADCPIPAGDFNWVSTLQPVVLRHWTVGHETEYEALTTIANWRGYGSVEFDGQFYGQKAHSFRRFFKLPGRTREEFILALAIHPEEHSDLRELERCGWRLLNPGSVAATPEAFQKFVQSSKAEFGVAKSGYVKAKCGWFSDRSICYLASGRPVIAQETGFSEFLPTGEGLFSFRTEEDVLSSIATLNEDYAKHCEAARAIAQDYFDSRKVLVKLLAQIGAVA